MNVKKLVVSTSLVAFLLGSGTVACGGSEETKTDAAAGADGGGEKAEKAKGEKAKGEKAKGEKAKGGDGEGH